MLGFIQFIWIIIFPKWVGMYLKTIVLKTQVIDLYLHMTLNTYKIYKTPQNSKKNICQVHTHL